MLCSKACRSKGLGSRCLSSCPYHLLQMAIACLHTDEGRITLQDRRLRIFRDALVDERQLDSDADVDAALAEHFGIQL